MSIDQIGSQNLNTKFGNKKYLIITAALAIAALLVFVSAVTVAADTSTPQIDIVGTNRVTINAIISSTFHFQPGTISVKQGDTITIKEHTGDAHTFTLVDASLEPTTANTVFMCGAPGTICGAVLATHLQPCLTAVPGSGLAIVCAGVLRMTGPPPTSCTVPDPTLPPPATVTFCNQFISPTGGSNPSSLSGLSLTTPWTAPPAPPATCNAPFGFCQGNSVIVFPGETDISFVVNLSPGTYHFMCVFHPWMQGDLIVHS
jgi:plastocyanin